MAYSKVPTATLASFKLFLATVVSSIAAGIVTTGAAHGLSVNQPIQFAALVSPSGTLANATVYYVKTTPTSTTFTYALTSGGSAITDSGATSGIAAPIANVTNNGIFIELSDLDGLTAAEADPTTGDMREIYRSIAGAMYNAYNAALAANRPAEMILNQQTSTNDISGVVTRTNTAQFLGTGDFSIAAEP